MISSLARSGVVRLLAGVTETWHYSRAAIVNQEEVQHLPLHPHLNLNRHHHLNLHHRLRPRHLHLNQHLASGVKATWTLLNRRQRQAPLAIVLTADAILTSPTLLMPQATVESVRVASTMPFQAITILRHTCSQTISIKARTQRTLT